MRERTIIRAAFITSVSIVALAALWPAAAVARPGNTDVPRRDAGATVLPLPKPAAIRKTNKKYRKSEQNADAALAVPPGPLHVIVSIDKQTVTLFANGVPIETSPISSGTPGHPTPLGVFSVIQKRRHHVSNLYDAKMPFMQRLTWSGTAMHQGPLPGRPASHGCIRLTKDFAQLLWKATKIGARVIITRDEVVPVRIEHARLFVPNPDPTPDSTPVAKPDVEPNITPNITDAPRIAPPPAARQSQGRALIQTADASNRVPSAVVRDAAKPMVTAAAGNAMAAAQPTKVVIEIEKIVAPSRPATPAPPPAPTPASSAARAIPPLKASGEATPGTTQPTKIAERPESPAPVVAMTVMPAEAPADAAPVAAPMTMKAEALIETAPPAAEPATPAAKPAKVAEAPIRADLGVPVIAAPERTIAGKAPAQPAPLIDTRLDTRVDTRVPAADIAPGPEKDVRYARNPAKPVSVFISRKQGKLYVRRGMAPLFSASVTIENPDRPIGTHVYTAMGENESGTGLRWTVITIPSNDPRAAELKKTGSKKSRHRKSSETDAGPPSTPNEALDRIVMPPDAENRIAQMMVPGSSLIVSDNKLSDETGDYTEFVVLTP